MALWSIPKYNLRFYNLSHKWLLGTFSHLKIIIFYCYVLSFKLVNKNKANVNNNYCTSETL